MNSSRRYKRTSSKIAKRQKARKYAGLFLKITLTLVSFVAVIVLARADFLQIKDFEISGTETLSGEEIKNTAGSFASGTELFLLPKSNIFLLNKEKLADVLLSKFTRLEKVDVNKQFFSKKIKLEISERKSDFLWCSSGGECFFMTKDGLVFEESGLTPLSGAVADKIVFRGVLEGNPVLKNFATPERMQVYLNFLEILKSAGFGVSSINVEYQDKAVANSNVGKIIFNPEEEDVSLVAQNVILLIDEIRSKNPSARFEHIDARFGNKIFYKLY